LLLSLCIFFITFFFLRLLSLTSLSSSCLPYYISPFVRPASEKGLHCQPTLTFFCKEITDFKLRPEPISETASVLHTYTKACVQRNQKELKPLFVSGRLPLNTGTFRIQNFIGSESEVKKIHAIYKLVHLTVTEY
jgi:hypothetical protein